MLTGMLLMALAAWFYTLAVDARSPAVAIILERERGAIWIAQLP